MYVNQDKKLIFIHNPKAAGRSIIKTLGFIDLNSVRFIHMKPAEAIAGIFQETWDQYFSFGFVRNPWDRMVPLYFYQRSIEYSAWAGRNSASHQIARMYDFSDWIMYNKSLSQSTWFNHAQTRWTENLSATYRFEDLKEILPILCHKANIGYNPIHVNSTPHDHYSTYYTREEIIEIVRDIDNETIKNHNYVFEFAKQ